MKIVIINKSDSTGGAAIVSRRLMEALRARGADARMLVAEKLTDSPYVEPAASHGAVKRAFLKERLKIFVANGFNRSTLFKIDTAAEGLPLWRHPLVKEADAVLLNWVNQGMLSLDGIRKIAESGKPIVWTMHDMWCMTGICHHAGDCRGYRATCGQCHLLGKQKGEFDISFQTWKRKISLYNDLPRMKFVAVSRWLAGKARESSLLRGRTLCVIPNTFTLPANLTPESAPRDDSRPIRILFGAARIDDPIKNLPALKAMTATLRDKYPRLADNMELVTFGNVKNHDSLKGISISHRHLGMVRGEENLRKIYEEGDILVSASSYETLPGTLVEAQAYGCIPVSFDQGGQRDITDHLQTGYLAQFTENIADAGQRLAEGVNWAANILADPMRLRDMKKRMRKSVETGFSPEAIAEAYLQLITS